MVLGDEGGRRVEVAEDSGRRRRETGGCEGGQVEGSEGQDLPVGRERYEDCKLCFCFPAREAREGRERTLLRARVGIWALAG